MGSRHIGYADTSNTYTDTANGADADTTNATHTTDTDASYTTDAANRSNTDTNTVLRPRHSSGHALTDTGTIL